MKFNKQKNGQNDPISYKIQPVLSLFTKRDNQEGEYNSETTFCGASQ